MRLNNRHSGANLAILAGLSIMLIGFLGVSVFVGLQVYMQGEISKAAQTAALTGASVYYSKANAATGRPEPDSAKAIQVAEDTFKAIVANSGALKGFGLTLTGPPTANDSNDSITVQARGAFATSFLAPVGIKQIEITESGTARALKYEPTQQLGPISILPTTGNVGSGSRMLNLVFPIVDGPGTELYVEQAGSKMAYIVEACNDTRCYDLTHVAKTVSGKKITSKGSPAVYGTCTFDFTDAKVNKASKLRFVHAMNFAQQFGNSSSKLSLQPAPLLINRVMIFGYAGTCPDKNRCPIPAGFAPVE